MQIFFDFCSRCAGKVRRNNPSPLHCKPFLLRSGRSEEQRLELYAVDRGCDRLGQKRKIRDQ